MTANFYQFESEDKKSALINKAMDQVVWFTEESGNILSNTDFVYHDILDSLTVFFCTLNQNCVMPNNLFPNCVSRTIVRDHSF